MSGPVWRYEKQVNGSCNVCGRDATGFYVEGEVRANSLGVDRRVCEDCYRRWPQLIVAGEGGGRSRGPAYAEKS